MNDNLPWAMEIMLTIELASLVGEHLLDAVDMSTEQVKGWDGMEDCNVIRFRLDGKVYTAIEDPEDGYRSSMERFYLSDAPMKNVFAPCKVLARMSAHEKDQQNDTLELLDCITGKVVLRAGTDNADDYYPYFVAEWSPENLSVNAGA